MSAAAVVALPPDGATRRQLLAARQHPAKMQLALVDLLVRCYTQPGDVVLDPLAGCGSLAIAALAGRYVLLGEIEPHFAAMCATNALAVRRHWACSGSIRCWQGDARALPLRDGCVHALISGPMVEAELAAERDAGQSEGEAMP